MSADAVKNWPSDDVMVNYDPVRMRVSFTTISTKMLLHSYNVSDGLRNGDCISNDGIVRPYVDLSCVSIWQRILIWLRSCLRERGKK